MVEVLVRWNESAERSPKSQDASLKQEESGS
ncbi:MAG: hypothetical protein BMS9Abin07_0351 [Acidimicrobiia bacterium]|nr:MAG: hypothetical protein BMS9Abin07_0351 [Acidimicrobiia bacterium]